MTLYKKQKQHLLHLKTTFTALKATFTALKTTFTALLGKIKTLSNLPLFHFLIQIEYNFITKSKKAFKGRFSRPQRLLLL